MAAMYVMHPLAINGATMERIGEMNSKTRQNQSRLVQEFSDTFGGIRAQSMRDSETRKQCRDSHLQ